MQNPKLASMSVNRNCHTLSYKHADKIIVDEISSINIGPQIIPAIIEFGKYKRMLRIGLRKCQPKLSQLPHPSKVAIQGIQYTLAYIPFKLLSMHI